MRERIDKLESLVLTALGESEKSSRESARRQVGEVHSSQINHGPEGQRFLANPNIGILETDSTERHLYSGETAWNTVLHEVRDLYPSLFKLDQTIEVDLF